MGSKIESDGVISIWDNAYNGNAWLSVDGITFEVINEYKYTS